MYLARGLAVAVVLLLSACSAGAPTGGLTFTVEGESVEFTVTAADGGTQSATAADGSKLKLAVPAGAVLEDTMTRMTPLSDVRGLGDGAVHAVQLDPASKPIVILLEHLSFGGVASVTPQQRATFLEKSASNAEARARIGEQRVRELTGQGDNDGVDVAEAASLARISDVITAMGACYTECEKAAITECQAEPDPDILVDFWTVMGRPADPDRAEKLCDPKGY